MSIPTSVGHPRSPFICMGYPPLCGGTASKGTDPFLGGQLHHTRLALKYGASGLLRIYASGGLGRWSVLRLLRSARHVGNSEMSVIPGDGNPRLLKRSRGTAYLRRVCCRRCSVDL